MENNYCINLKKTIIIVFLICYLIISIISELFYRDPLFELSISFERKLQNEIPAFLGKYFEIISKFGSKKIILPFIIGYSFFIPFNKTFSLLIVVFNSVYVDNIMKIIYSSPRPSWIDQSLNKYCDGSFGNPSGHAFLSSSFYLFFWTILVDYDFFIINIYGIIIKFILLGVFLLFIGSILLSRLYLGVHSTNQVLYGANLGITSFFFYYFVLGIHKMTPKFFMDKLKEIKIYLLAFFSFCICLAITLYFFVSYQTNEKYTKFLQEKCPNLNKVQYLNNDGLYDTLTLFGLIGVYIGLLFVKRKTDLKFPNQEELIINWNLSSLKRRIIRYIFFVFFTIPYIVAFFIPSDAHLAIQFCIKISLCYFLTGFGMFGPGFYYGYKLIRFIYGNEIIGENIENIQPFYLEMNKQLSI